MRRTIHVALGENARTLGMLRFDAQGARENAAFDYDAAWLAADDRFAIDPGLALVRGPQFHRKERGGSVFPGAIADTEPDGWARRVILRDRARRRQSGIALNRKLSPHIKHGSIILIPSDIVHILPSMCAELIVTQVRAASVAMCPAKLVAEFFRLVSSERSAWAPL